MNKIPPLDRQEDDRVDDYYRQASALDQSRPSEAVRQAIVTHAAKLAVERTTQRPVRSWPARSWWNPAFFGSLAAASIVGFLVTPQLFRIGEPSEDRNIPRAPPVPALSAPRPRAESSAPVRTEPVTDANAKANAKAAYDANIAVAKKSAGLDHGLARNEVPVAASAQANLAAAGAASAVPATAEVAAPPSARARQATDAGVPTAMAEHADINATDAAGRTALMVAVVRNQADTVEDLLLRGADPNVADSYGKTPLEVAVENHQPAIIAALKRAGAR